MYWFLLAVFIVMFLEVRSSNQFHCVEIMLAWDAASQDSKENPFSSFFQSSLPLWVPTFLTTSSILKAISVAYGYKVTLPSVSDHPIFLKRMLVIAFRAHPANQG